MDALQCRSEDEQVRDDITTRSFECRASSWDEKTKSVRATLATEDATTVMDRKQWEPIKEVLRMDGCQMRESIPLLDNHDRYGGAMSVHGSIRDMAVDGDRLECRAVFDEDADSQRIAGKVQRGHVRDLSVGYEVNEATDIPAGQTAEVKGKRYTAPADMRLRIATRWTPKEGSVVPIGADQRAKTRSAAPDQTRKEQIMPEELKTDEVKTEIKTEETRAAVTPPVAQVIAPVAPQVDRAAIAAEERARIADIRRHVDNVPAELVARAVDEGWTADKYRAEFLDAYRAARSPSAGSVAIHNRDPKRDMTAQTLGLALAMRGMDGERYLKCNAAYAPVGQVRNGCGDYTLRREMDVENHRKAMANLLQQADEYRSMSLVDICRVACQLDGNQIGYTASPEEAFRTAVSGSALQQIFTTNINAQFLTGYMDAPDTTVGWTSEADVANFLTQERDMMGKFGGLTRHQKGGKAEHLDTFDYKEEYKIGRYSGQFVVDEMDIINDRFGAIEATSPMDMGNTARQVRPNLVYYIVLKNAALDVDATALFDASTHKNYGTSTTALTAAHLQTAIAAMAQQRIKNRVLNLTPRYLIVPQDLRFAAEIIMTSAQRIISADSGGTFNPLERLGIQIVADDRMGVAGVIDPATNAAQPGTATNYLLSCRPGEGGAKTIEVGYLRGSGRAPQMRSFVLDKGQWGLGWDIKLDIGAKALDYRGMYFATGGS